MRRLLSLYSIMIPNIGNTYIALTYFKLFSQVEFRSGDLRSQRKRANNVKRFTATTTCAPGNN